MTSKQLIVVNKNIKIPLLSDADGVRYINVPEYPYAYWPDHSPCFPVNSYLLHLLTEKGERLSLSNGGGTVTAYAKELTHIIRFCHKNNIPMGSLSERRFVSFCNYLKAEIDPVSSTSKRSGNHVARILRRTLDLLEYLNSKLAGGNSWQIKAEKKEKQGRDGRKLYAWYHSCIPVEEAGEARLPIGENVVKRLKDGIRELWPNTDPRAYVLQKRKLLLISVLEKLGCRRAEAVKITVEAIYDAFNSQFKRPLLKIPSVKGKRKYRYVPVSRVLLGTWIDYIETVRQQILHQNGIKNDHGFLFVNVTNGQPISINYVTTEINELRRKLKIVDPCHAHIFRHRFITEVVKALAFQYKAQTTEGFRELLLNDARLLKDLREWIGHRSIQSLSVYIDLAFSELAGIPEAYEEVRIIMTIDDCSDVLDEIQVRFNAGELSETEFIYLSRQALDAAKIEMRRASR